MKPAGGSTESFTYTGVDSTQRTSAGTATFTNNELGVASRKVGSTTAYFTRIPAGSIGRLQGMLVGSSRSYYLYDGTGNVIGLINASGTRIATYAYSPYGTTTASTGTQAATNPFRYEAGYTDTTGLIHFGARYLNPQLGTWTQKDPASLVPSYSYAGDDPINSSDPTGRFTKYLLVVGVSITVLGVGAFFLGASVGLLVVAGGSPFLEAVGSIGVFGGTLGAAVGGLVSTFGAFFTTF